MGIVECSSQEAQLPETDQRGAFRLFGRGYSVDVAKGADDKLLVTRVVEAKKGTTPDERRPIVLIHGRIKFCDATIAGVFRGTARTQLDQLVEQAGSYLNIWRGVPQTNWSVRAHCVEPARSDGCIMGRGSFSQTAAGVSVSVTRSRSKRLSPFFGALRMSISKRRCIRLPNFSGQPMKPTFPSKPCRAKAVANGFSSERLPVPMLAYVRQSNHPSTMTIANHRPRASSS